MSDLRTALASSSPSEPTATPPAAGRLRRSLRWLLLLALGLGVAYWALTSWASAQVAERVAAFPRPADLDFKAQIPPPLPAGTKNAIDFFESAALLIDGSGALRKPSQPGNLQDPPADQELQVVADRFRVLDVQLGQLDGTDLERCRQLVAKHALPLEILDRGFAEARGARYAADYSVVPMAIEIPNMITYLRLAALLRARAEVAKADGRAAEAWQGVGQLFQMAGHVESSMNTLIHALITRAISQQGAALAQSLLRDLPADPTVREMAVRPAAALSPGTTLERAFSAETAAAYNTLIDPRSPRHPNLGFGQKSSWLGSSRLVLQLEAAAYLDWAEKARAICSRPSHQNRDAEKELLALQPPARYPRAQALSYSCIDASRRRDAWQVSLDQLKIGLALEQWREQQGQYPKSLAALGAVGQLVDPFANQAYRYRLEGQGYRLYSVGGNGVDDRGEQKSASPGAAIDLTQGDLAWWVTKK